MSTKGKVEKGIAEIKADMASFDPDAILRGAQLTLVGAHRAMQNPKLFTGEHYRQAALAVAAGIAIRILISIPVGFSALKDVVAMVLLAMVLSVNMVMVRFVDDADDFE